jgi:hypothetical protein
VADHSDLGDAVERLESERRAKADSARREVESRAQAVRDMDARTLPLITDFLAAASHIEPITFEMDSRTVTYPGRFGRKKQRHEPVLLSGHLIYSGGRRPLPTATHFGRIVHSQYEPHSEATRPPGDQSIIIAPDGRVYASVPWESIRPWVTNPYYMSRSRQPGQQRADHRLLAEQAYVPGFVAEFDRWQSDGRKVHAFVSRGNDDAVGKIAFHAAYRTNRNGHHALRNGVFVWKSWDDGTRTFEGIRAGIAEVAETVSFLANWCAIYLDQNANP